MKNTIFILASFLTILTVQAEKVAVKDTLAFDDFNRETIGANYTLTDASKIAIDNARLKFTNVAEVRNTALARLQTAVKFGEAATDSIVFTCSMRHNYSTASTELSGFETGKRGLATILAATEDVSATTGSGYAIVLGKIVDTSTGPTFRLVRFENGLNSNSNFTIVVDGTTDMDGKNYFTLRVVYLPASNTWRFYQNKGGTDAATAPDDIAATDWTYNGEAVDATLASTVLNRFGFMHNGAGDQTFNGYFDNFSAIAYSMKEPVVPVEVETEVVTASIYSDSFDGRTTLSNNTHTYTADSLDSEKNLVKVADGVLNIAAPGARWGVSIKGRQGVYGEYANMQGTLHSQDADSLVWMFNIRNNYSKTDPLSGFAGDQRGIAVVFATKSAKITDGTKGYAVVYGGNGKQQFRLAQFTNGVKGERFTDIIAGTEFANQGKDYFSIRVVYVPKTDTWRLYDYTNGTDAFLKPNKVTDWNFCGEAVDATNTGVQDFNKFFFFQNFTGKLDFNFIIDNYTLDSYHTGVVLSDEANPMPYLNQNNGKTVLLALSRPLTKGMYNTICLPCDLNAQQRQEAWGTGCTIQQLTDATLEGNVINLTFNKLTNADVMKAGTPYLIQPLYADIVDNIALRNVTIDTQTRPVTFESLISFEGVLAPTALTKDDKKTLFLGADNTLYYPSEDAEMKGFRAIFRLLESAPANVAARVIIRNKADETTPTEAIREPESMVSKKILRNGRFIILHNRKEYNVLGND